MSDSKNKANQTPPNTVELEPESVYELAKRFPNYVRDSSDFKCEKEIGRGGFGVVWLGDDLKTKQKVAVKEFLSYRLSRRQTTHFIREIYTMAISRSPFVVPLVGFTVEHPYTIITKFEENGQLSKFIKNKTSSTSKKLTGTQLTTIALCIASALVDFSDLHILHRDLKSSNVLMDDELIPKICDFGTARIYSSNLTLTQRLGTVNFMSPEIIRTSNYNEKVDVYDFGMILYEMNEGRLPHSEMKREELLEALPDHPIPLEFRNSSREMTNFIKSLTDFDPNKRPTIQEAFQAFATGKIAFPGTKKNRIQKVLKTIQKKSAKKKELPPLYVNIDEILRKLEENQQIMADDDQDEKGNIFDSASGHFTESTEHENTTKFDFTLLDDPSKEGFIENLEKAKNEVKRFQYPELSTSLTKAIQHKPDDNVIIAIYSLILYFVQQDLSIYIALAKASFFHSMIMTTEPMKKLCIEILGLLFRNNPKLIKVSFTKSITTLIQFDPESMIIMLCHYINNLPPQEDSFPVIGIFIDQSDSFFGTQSETNFIRCIYHLLSTNKLFKEQMAEQLSPVLMKGCQSTNEETAITTLHALANLLPDDNIIVDFEVVLQVAGNQNLQKHLISVLIRLKKFPASRRIAYLLFNYATVSQRGFLSLMNFCESSPDNAKLVATMDKWMKSGLPTIHNTFRILMLLFKDVELRPIIYQSASFPEMMKMFVGDSDVFLYTCLPSILRRSNLDDNLLKSFQKSGFWESFFNIAVKSDNKKVINASLIMADTVSAVGFVPEMVPLIRRMVDFLKDYQSLTQQTITVLVRMSYLEEAREHLTVFVRYFKTLSSYPSYKQYANTFLENMGQKDEA